MSGGPFFALKRLVRRMSDALMTAPLVRWTWLGLAEQDFRGDLPDFRPPDRDAVREMMSGRYLLASKLIETGGVSPFALDVEHPDWWHSLHCFSWLRHFRDVEDPGERLFARTLVLDWIWREGRFAHKSWSLTLTAQRVLNWLRHLTLLLEGATPEQARTIRRSLGTQIQSLRVRAPLASDPVETLFAAIGLAGAEMCAPEHRDTVEHRLHALEATLAGQLDAEGLHKSRNSRIQLALLVELTSLRRAAGNHASPSLSALSDRIDRMHEALDTLTLSSGELAYFNGCGQVAHDVLVAVQARGPALSRRSRLLGGYGILRCGQGVLIADSGQRPPPGFDAEAHAGALAFEFSHGNELIVGSCGPSPAELPQTRDLFRQAIAHSSATIDGQDPAPTGRAGKKSGKKGSRPDSLELDPAQHMLVLSGAGYARRFGAEIERRMTFLDGGATLVGQDRIVATTAKGQPKGQLILRFHLAPGIDLEAPASEGMRRLTLANGEVWNFLWEGAHLRTDDSVRQSAYLGFARTVQLILEADITPGLDIGWIFTRES